MNPLFSFLVVAALWGTGVRWRTAPANRVRIGAFYYDIALRTDHRPAADDTYFVVSGPASCQEQCGGTQRVVTRAGVVLSRGKYGVDGARLVLLERLFTPPGYRGEAFPDSVVRTFVADRTGQLRFTGTWAYWAGKAKKIR